MTARSKRKLEYVEYPVSITRSWGVSGGIYTVLGIALLTQVHGFVGFLHITYANGKTARIHKPDNGTPVSVRFKRSLDD